MDDVSPTITKPKRIRVGIITKQCETCGMSITKQASRFREHVFCSRECYWKSPYHRDTVAAANARRHPVDVVIVKQCEQCGVDVRRSRSQYRNHTFCSQKCRENNRAATSKPQITSSGYVKVYVGRSFPGADSKGHILVHRKVMQERLGRTLLPEENVHHINGVKDDNRPENLELWSTSQPSGQRVSEKIAWAKAFLSLYET